MVKFACLLLFLLTLTACGDGGVVPAVQAEAYLEQDASTDENVGAPYNENGDGAMEYEAEPEPAAPTVFALNLGGNVIEMDQNMEDVIQMLGEPMGVFEAPSCAFDGIDRVFRFPGVQIHTYPLGDEDFVHTISLRDDTVTTTGGIFLGQSLEDVKAVYGEDFVQEYGMFTFTRGQTTLSFLIEGNVVIAITYGLLLDI